MSFSCRHGLMPNRMIGKKRMLSTMFYIKLSYIIFETEMSNKRYVDSFAAPMLLKLDRAKNDLVEKLKNRLVDELEVNEKMRNNHVKLEEQIKVEVEKNATLEAEKHALEEMLATKEEVIKVLTDGANRNEG